MEDNPWTEKLEALRADTYVPTWDAECPVCGTEIVNIPGRTLRYFCSKICRSRRTRKGQRKLSRCMES